MPNESRFNRSLLIALAVLYLLSLGAFTVLSILVFLFATRSKKLFIRRSL